MLYVIIFVAALLALFLLCISECNETREQRRRDPDASCCRTTLIVITFVILIWAGGKPAKQVERDPMQIYIGGFLPRRRNPDYNLSPADYMMGLELAKAGTCIFFNMARDADIDRFKRCAHFYPELLTEFRERYQEQVGFCI